MAVIFGPDAFAVGANQNLDTYPTGAADYAMNEGASGDLVVNAVNDRVQAATNASDPTARVIDAAVPASMGDQEMRCDGVADQNNGSYSCEPVVRVTAADITDYYLGYYNAGTLEMYRVVDGNIALINSGPRTITSGGNTWRFRATGTNPVNLELQVGGTATLTFGDTNGNRHQSGRPGCGAYSADPGVNVAWFDNLVVDDLASALRRRVPTSRPRPFGPPNERLMERRGPWS